jgi:hypothetical protein
MQLLQKWTTSTAAYEKFVQRRKSGKAGSLMPLQITHSISPQEQSGPFKMLAPRKRHQIPRLAENFKAFLCPGLG